MEIFDLCDLVTLLLKQNIITNNHKAIENLACTKHSYKHGSAVLAHDLGVGDAQISACISVPKPLASAFCATADGTKTCGVQHCEIFLDKLLCDPSIDQERLLAFLMQHYAIKSHDKLCANKVIASSIRLPRSVLLQRQWVALEHTKDHISLAIANPVYQRHQEQLEVQLNKKIHWRIIAHATCHALYRAAITEQVYSFYRKNIEQEDLPTDVDLLLQNILQQAVWMHASDIHLEPMQYVLRVRFRVRGLLNTIAKLHISLHQKIINYLKVKATLDISQQRLPQDGQMQFQLDPEIAAYKQLGAGACDNSIPQDAKYLATNVPQQVISCRMSSCPFQYMGTNAEKVVLRLLNKHSALLDYSQLGMEPAHVQSFQLQVRKPQGLILVTGPTGSGKTHTLYAALDDLNNDTRHIATIEDPIEIPLPGIFQMQVQAKVGLSFSAALRSLLRQDPDVLMVGEIRDEETAHIAIHAAQTGHLVLATLHTNSACHSITRLLHLGLPAYLVADSLQLVIAQRLVRHLCLHCRIVSSATQAPAAPHGASKACNNKLQYHYQENPAGCTVCKQGWQGRIGLFEMLRCDAGLREKIYQQASTIELESYAQQHGFKNLQSQALTYIARGTTTTQEIQRVIGSS